MSVTEFEMFQDRQRSNWVRLRTLNSLRWFAIIGQSIALIVAVNVFSLKIVVGLSRGIFRLRRKLPGAFSGVSVALIIFGSTSRTSIFRDLSPLVLTTRLN